ncbi:uncharacterized protein [Euwallacea similis]|uniref:uncharacterized protein isoform X2 n=1 Tax=Euwallacea similis TaxID=1736056 RepID=UPI00344E75D6
MLPNALFWRLLLRVSVLLFFIRAVISTDEYVKDLRKKCMKTKRPFFCVTFRIAKYVQEFDYHGPPYGPLKLVKIKQEGLAVGDLLPTPRFVSTDTEWDKFVKFLQRKLVNFVTSHGIAFEVPQGIQVVGERSFSEVEGTIQDKSHEEVLHPNGDGRGHKMKEKKIFILSVIIMAKLIKILILVNMIFFALLFIKKIILVTSIVFPSVLSHIKQACQQHHQQHTALPIIEKESPLSSWFGWRQDNAEKPYY